MNDEVKCAIGALIIVTILFIPLIYIDSNKSYIDVYVPSIDKTFQCLDRTHNINYYTCVQPSGKEITIRGEYIIGL